MRGKNMERNIEIMDKLYSYVLAKENEVVIKEYFVDNITFDNLRDCLIGNAKILEEDFEKQIYVVTVDSCINNINGALIVIQRVNNNKLSLAGYAREGWINQHTAEKAILKIIEQIKSKYKECALL